MVESKMGQTRLKIPFVWRMWCLLALLAVFEGLLLWAINRCL